MMDDEEGWRADTMDEYAQQQLKGVQGKDGVTDSLFDDGVVTRHDDGAVRCRNDVRYRKRNVTLW
jgi:hypothetical protein